MAYRIVTRDSEGPLKELLSRASGVKHFLDSQCYSILVKGIVFQGAQGDLTLHWEGAHSPTGTCVGGKAVFDEGITVEELRNVGFEVKPTVFRRVGKALGVC
ncbi:MAG: hypothetical protein MRY79_07780 [Alphaproteobacteria bacterium]|nr:hypothetical protein [Alphaproteobacteria bacterium]